MLVKRCFLFVQSFFLSVDEKGIILRLKFAWYIAMHHVYATKSYKTGVTFTNLVYKAFNLDHSP